MSDAGGQLDALAGVAVWGAVWVLRARREFYGGDCLGDCRLVSERRGEVSAKQG